MSDFYNDTDNFACEWLSNLAFLGDVPSGTIDRRSISDIQPQDLNGFRQCHFFAGIGGWAEALRLAGWPEDRQVWTGSCPCQPFSSAGKRRGTADKRHLWPEFLRLIAKCRPATIFGEQVASKDGRTWLATVRTDLEALGYAVGAADLCAAGVGAPHIRQRLYWVADTGCKLRDPRRDDQTGAKTQRCEQTDLHQRRDSGLGDANGTEREARDVESVGAETRSWHVAQSSVPSRLADCDGQRWQGQIRIGSPSEEGQPVGHSSECGCGHWDDVDLVYCRDGKARPVKPRIRLLAHGVPNRVGSLRGFGNAIVPQVASIFVKAFLDGESL